MKALIVDDDRILADVITFTLRREGYEVIVAEDGESAIKQWAEEHPDLIVLDVNLPKMDGFTICEKIRKQEDTAIIMLSVRGEEDDIIHGLKMGADDYITKPFSPRQLIGRAEAVLRRARKVPPATVRQVGDLRLDVNRHALTISDGISIALTMLEYRLLDCLMINKGQVVTADIIIYSVWGSLEGDKDMLRQLIHRLRQKIEPDPAHPTFIETISGLGYALHASRERV